MKSKTMILMGIAIVCGLGASYMTSRLLAERNETVTVLVAKQTYRQWTLIKDPQTMFDAREVPKNDAPKTAVVDPEDLKDRILIRTVPEGQPVAAEDLQDKNKGTLETQIAPGMRAVAIKTDAQNCVGGFVLPGSHVDVYHAVRTSGSHADTKCILQNILVRAVDLNNVRPDDKPGIVPATVTLEVSPQQALLLTSFKDTGTLTLGLRSVGDFAVVNDAEPAKPKAPPAPPKVLVAQKTDPIERKFLTIYNGPNWTRATFSTQHGRTTTEIESSKPEPNFAPVAPLASPPSPAASSPATAPKPGTK